MAALRDEFIFSIVLEIIRGNKLPPFLEYKYHHEKNCTTSHLRGFFIAGCDSVAERKIREAEQAGKDTMETQVVLRDGRKITCLVYHHNFYGGAAGLSCDWYNAPPIQPPYPSPSKLNNNRQIKS
ncbi:hypothetical protein [Snodgrassella communis]|uniref:hypothetical protein n=1 Tax=Snodgrassella communis TaxID=2946699 RepID=UPI000C1F3C27|nr:hypothetical protein [Snodgrassella communis]PIT19895.1 hypothetical protein BGI35_09405 [Snodgrassella communis]